MPQQEMDYLQHIMNFQLILLCFFINELNGRPTEEERVALWYERGNTWPPKWQNESEKFTAAMDFREKEIMRIPGYRERWENFMQLTAVRMVPHFTEFGFQVVQAPPEIHAKLFNAVREAVLKWDELPAEGQVDIMYHPPGARPKFVQIGSLIREVSTAKMFNFVFQNLLMLT